MSEMIDVLLIDDSATIRKVVELAMRGSTFRPHFSALGGDGVTQARQLRPSAILLDCVLPDSSGVQVCRQLAADERTRSIPVLLVSAKADSVRGEFRDFANVVDFVAKPFTGPDLLRRIRRALGEGAAAPARVAPKDQERAAKILYARLRDGLALVPALTKQLGTSPPGPFFAKRLLTPEAVAGIVDDLFSLYDELRNSGDARPEIEPLQPTAILDRATGFSERIRRTSVGSTSRRVLTLINGQLTLDEIARRAGLEGNAVGRIARELVDVGLLEDRKSSARARSIVILEPDVQGFQVPLASFLEARREAPALIPVTSVRDVVTTVRRVHPCLVVVNATGEASSVGDAARELRSDATLSDIALVAVLDRAQHSVRDDLYSAGFDAVLNKPVIVGDLERFIAPCGAPPRKEEPWIRS